MLKVKRPLTCWRCFYILLFFIFALSIAISCVRNMMFSHSIQHFFPQCAKNKGETLCFQTCQHSSNRYATLSIVYQSKWSETDIETDIIWFNIIKCFILSSIHPHSYSFIRFLLALSMRFFCLLIFFAFYTINKKNHTT